MTKRYNFELWHSVEKEFLKVTIIEDNGFLTGKSDKQNFFLQFPQSSFRVEDFNPKSIKSGEIVGKVYNFKNGEIP
jgi:hypothetical protein